MARRVLPLVAVTLAAACSATEAPSDARPDDLPELVLEEELRIGSLDDPVRGFTRIGDVWVSPEGEVWVSDAGAWEIRVYDGRGRLLRSYGREGDGPGEFRSIHSFGIVGDTLWVSDSSIGRTTLFSLDGEVLETVTARVLVRVGEDPSGTSARILVFPHALRPDGLVESTYEVSALPNLGDSVATLPRVVFNMRGEIVDTVGTVEVTVSRRAEALRLGGGSTAYFYPEPPSPESDTLTVELASGRYSIAWAPRVDGPRGELVARFVAASGDTTFQRRTPYVREPVTEGYLDSLAASRARGRSRSDSARIFRAARAALDRPEYHRPISGLTRVGERTAWARHAPGYSTENAWLVYSEEPERWGVVVLPRLALPKWSDGRRVWVRERDDLGVHWLVRYRIGD